jgi:hypothetical protein
MVSYYQLLQFIISVWFFKLSQHTNGKRVREYIETVHLELQEVKEKHVQLLKGIARCKVKIPCHFVDLQMSIHITSLPILLFNFLQKSLPFALCPQPLQASA